MKFVIIWLPLGDETVLCLSDPGGEVHIDPLDSCSSSTGGDGDLPFSSVLLDAELGIFETHFCTPQIVSKSGLVVRDGGKGEVTSELKLVSSYLYSARKKLLVVQLLPHLWRTRQRSRTSSLLRSQPCRCRLQRPLAGTPSPRNSPPCRWKRVSQNGPLHLPIGANKQTRNTLPH